MKRLLREPLLHFLLLGALLLGLKSLLHDPGQASARSEILVTEGRIESLAAVFIKTRQRAPSTAELRSLIDDYVLEEALYREAMSLGLDRDDTIVRRRLRQKMEFVVKDIVQPRRPAEGELETWFETHRKSYQAPARYDFRQVQLKTKLHGDAIQSDAEKLLEQLRAGVDAKTAEGLGDSSLLEHAHADVDANVVAATFGQTFAEGLAKLPPGTWSGPIASPYGLHLVLVDRRTLGKLPTLAEVRKEVERDWSHELREKAMRTYYRKLVDGYGVQIEWPKPR